MSKPRFFAVAVTGVLLAGVGDASAETAGAAAPMCNQATIAETVATKAPVPLDARILLRPGGCFQPTTDVFSLRLESAAPGSGSIELDTTTIRASVDGTFASIKPKQKLEPSTAYVLTLAPRVGTPGQSGSSVKFTTGTDETTPTIETPTLEVVSGTYIPPSQGVSQAGATFNLRLSMPKGGAIGGAFYVNGKKLTKDPSGNDTDGLKTFDGETTVETSTYRAITPGETTCFTVVYEDPAGRVSPSSASSCLVAARGPDPVVGPQPQVPTESTVTSGVGCSSSPASAPLSSSTVLGALGILGLFAFRRRNAR